MPALRSRRLRFAAGSALVAAGVLSAGGAWATNYVTNGNFTAFDSAYTNSFQMAVGTAPSSGGPYNVTNANNGSGTTQIDHWANLSEGYAFLVQPGQGQHGDAQGMQLYGTTGSSNQIFLYSMPTYNAAQSGNAIWVDPDYSGSLTANATPGISQTLTGLTVGDQYQVQFWQASGQQYGFYGSTTTYWQVSFGTDAVQDSPAQTNLAGNVQKTTGNSTPWELVTLDFVATATTQTLGFFAVVNPVPSCNLPPFIGINGISVIQVPEPAALTIVSLGVAGLIVARRRRKVAA